MGIYTNYPDSIYDNGAGGGGGDVGAPYLKNIMPTTGVKVVDENGYIGGNFFGVYYPNTNYYNNFAIVVPGADYSNEGLGTVTFVDTTATIGGRVYRIVTIAGVTWLAENLDYKFSGCCIGGSGYPSTPNAWYYDNDEQTYGIDGERKCGLLYNWHAVNLLNSNRSDLIPGWHVPNRKEWDTLFTNVGGAAVAGTRLKLDNVSWAPSWNGTNDFNFGILPAGRYTSSGFLDIENYAYFWTSSTTGVQDIAKYVDSGAGMISGNFVHGNGFSVRLVKDSA